MCVCVSSVGYICMYACVYIYRERERESARVCVRVCVCVCVCVNFCYQGCLSLESIFGGISTNMKTYSVSVILHRRYSDFAFNIWDIVIPD